MHIETEIEERAKARHLAAFGGTYPNGINWESAGASRDAWRLGAAKELLVELQIKLRDALGGIVDKGVHPTEVAATAKYIKRLQKVVEGE